MNYKLKLRYSDLLLWQQILFVISTNTDPDTINYTDYYNARKLLEALERKKKSLMHRHRKEKSYAVSVSPNEFDTWEKLLKLNKDYLAAKGNESVTVLVQDIQAQGDRQRQDFKQTVQSC